jgi:hypothetical protein
LIAFLCVNAARAIDPNRMVSQYVVERWSVEQWFSFGPVYAIGQAGDVYLLIGTLNGLVRFDGIAFQQMHSADVEPLLSRVVGLVTDTQGVSWLHLGSGGVTFLKYEHGSFRNVVSDLTTVAALETMARGKDGEALCLLNYHACPGSRADGERRLLAGYHGRRFVPRA